MLSFLGSGAVVGWYQVSCSSIITKSAKGWMGVMNLTDNPSFFCAVLKVDCEAKSFWRWDACSDY